MSLMTELVRIERRPKVIVRMPEVLRRVGLGKTSFKERFEDTGKAKIVRIGPRIKGMLESDLERLVELIASEGMSAPKPTKKPRQRR